MLEVVWRPVVMLRITNGRRRAPERTIIWIYPRFLRTEAQNQTDGQTCDWSKKKKKAKKKAETRHDVTFVSGELMVRVPWRSNTFYAPFYFHHIWSPSSQRARGGSDRNTITPPLLCAHTRTHTHRLPLNYAKRPFNKYGPHNTKDSRYSDISPTFLVFFLSSSLDVSKTPR